MTIEELDKNVIEAKSLLSSKKKIVIVPHMSPDGDAMGSSCALYMFLKNEGHDVSIVSSDQYPSYLSWLPSINEVIVFTNDNTKAKTKIAEAELIFFLDHNDENRQGFIQKKIGESKAVKIMIDHHPYPKAKVELMFSRIDVTSTCEMIYEFIAALGMKDKITKDIATCIYTGINTDTGGLNYNSAFPQTYKIVASLLENGLDKGDVHERLYNTSSESRMRLMGFCLSQKMIIVPDCKTAVMSLSMEEMERFNYQEGDAEGFVNIPHGIKGIDISIYLSEKKDKVKISFRSKRNIPINIFAAEHFNGGGHKNAAGGALELPLAEVEKKVLDLLPAFVKEHGEN
jgi:phosphoesterase RecJ-like protein